MNRYQEWDAELNALRHLRKDSRKIARNTYLERRPNGSIVIRLRQTDILTYWPCGRIIVNTGGYNTKLTRARIEDHLWPHAWLVMFNDRLCWHHLIPFTDGDEIRPDWSVRAKQERPIDRIAF